MGEAKAHVLTAKGWEMRALNEDAEAIIRFALSMRMCRRSIGAKSVDVYPEYRLDVRVSIGHVACEWSTINDVGEPILVDADVVPLAIRCDLLAACAVLPDDQSPSV